MEIRCPSCGRSHNTEDYVGAFDIQCSCGYKILMPDLEAIEADKQNPTNSFDEPFQFNSQPENPSPEIELAPDSTDQAMSSEDFAVDQLSVADIEREAERNQLINVEDSNTPPPRPTESGLLYDPFELEHDRRQMTSAPQQQSEHQFQGEEMVTRIRENSLNRMTGPFFNLKFENLEDPRRRQFFKRCQDFIKSRPWLETLLNEKGIRIDFKTTAQSFEKIPEILAVHMYLEAVRLGAQCTYEICLETPELDP